jgi:hypothetical protein
MSSTDDLGTDLEEKLAINGDAKVENPVTDGDKKDPADFQLDSMRQHFEAW